MKKIVLTCALSLTAFPVFAQNIKCDDSWIKQQNLSVQKEAYRTCAALFKARAEFLKAQSEAEAKEMAKALPSPVVGGEQPGPDNGMAMSAGIPTGKPSYAKDIFISNKKKEATVVLDTGASLVVHEGDPLTFGKVVAIKDNGVFLKKDGKNRFIPAGKGGMMDAGGY